MICFLHCLYCFELFCSILTKTARRLCKVKIYIIMGVVKVIINKVHSQDILILAGSLLVSFAS